MFRIEFTYNPVEYSSNTMTYLAHQLGPMVRKALMRARPHDDTNYLITVEGREQSVIRANLPDVVINITYAVGQQFTRDELGRIHRELVQSIDQVLGRPLFEELGLHIVFSPSVGRADLSLRDKVA